MQLLTPEHRKINKQRVRARCSSVGRGGAQPVDAGRPGGADLARAGAERELGHRAGHEERIAVGAADAHLQRGQPRERRGDAVAAAAHRRPALHEAQRRARQPQGPLDHALLLVPHPQMGHVLHRRCPTQDQKVSFLYHFEPNKAFL
jgi:hypothetical protein